VRGSGVDALGKAWRKVTVLLMLTALLTVQALPVQAQTLTVVLPDPYINYTFLNGTLIVDSTFYRITVNTSNGIIESITFKLDKDYQLYPSGTPPIAVAYAPVEVRDNPNLTLVEFSRVDVVDYGEGVLTILFQEPKTPGFDGSLTIVLDYTKPYLDFVLDVPPGTTALIVAANSTLADTWILSASVYEAGAIKLYTTTEKGAQGVGGGFDAAAMIGVTQNNDTNILSYVYGMAAIPGYKGPDFIGMFGKDQIHVTNYTVGDDAIVLGAMFYPQNNSLIGVRVSTFKYDPYAVVASNLVRPISAVYDGVINDIKPIIYYTQYVKVINNTIQTLNDQIARLQEENANLSKQLAELQGCESYWQAELQKLRLDLARVRDQLQTMGAVSIAAFIAGIILGVIGGAYVFEGLRSGRRKK